MYLSNNLISYRIIKRGSLCVLSLIFLFFIQLSFAKPLIVTYRSPVSDKDHRHDYDNLLLKISLDKTIEEYGEYELRPSEKMNNIRAVRTIQNNLKVNFFTKLSYDDVYNKKDLVFIKFPVDLGVVGHRICFVSPDRYEEVSQMTSLAELRTLVYGQGEGWKDVDILRHNGFNVKTVNHYKSLFPMVAKNRFDLFCRGINELHEEYELNREIPSLMYNKTIAFYYPLPRFFYTHSSNKLAAERIQKGLILAFYDGSIKKIWLDHYKKGFDFADLDNRKTFILENPYIKELHFNFEYYLYTTFLQADKTRKIF